MEKQCFCCLEWEYVCCYDDSGEICEIGMCNNPKSSNFRCETFDYNTCPFWIKAD